MEGLEALGWAQGQPVMHDLREWDDDAVKGLWDPEYLAAKYDRILNHYGLTASRLDDPDYYKGMPLPGQPMPFSMEEEEQQGEEAGALPSGSTAGSLPGGKDESIESASP
jgi:hypothetical protein